MNGKTITEEQLLEALRRYWGYGSLRGTQSRTIRCVLEGRDTLSLMPTGGGKSLTYQLPGLLMEGLCVVVTPLVALMKDQVDSLRRRGIPAVAIHSGMSPRNIDITLDNCVYGDIKFLYVSPERVAGELFAARLAKMNVNLIAVDEAHCISQWGYDFRPAYLRIARMRDILPAVPVLALTASATEPVAQDIMEKLAFREPNVVRSDYARPNLSFSVRHTDDRKGQLLRVIGNVPGSGIVYVRTRDAAELLAAELKEEGIAAEYYHAGLPHGERTLRQNEWTAGKTRVMVATNAFGMGIDKPDVRFVVHYGLCASLEEYYQEAGRAGRDGRRSYAVLIVASDDRERLTRRFSSEFPTIAQIKDIYVRLMNYLGVAIGEGKFCSMAVNLYDFCARNRLFMGTVQNALKMLQQNGYLVFTDDEENPARLMFCVSRDDLYSLRVEREDLDNILRTILRLYTGVFTGLRPVDVQEMAIYTGYTEERVMELLKTLWRLHVIRFVPKNRSPMVFLTDNRLPDANVYISPGSYRARKETAARRLEAVFAYAADTERCRSVVLQEYFGQKDARPCGVCDICLAHRKRGTVGEGMAGEILKRIPAGGISPKDLAGQFAAAPEKVAAAVDALAAEGKISVMPNGLLVINR